MNFFFANVLITLLKTITLIEYSIYVTETIFLHDIDRIKFICQNVNQSSCSPLAGVYFTFPNRKICQGLVLF